MSSSDSTDSEEALQFSDQDLDEDRGQLAAEVIRSCIAASFMLCRHVAPACMAPSLVIHHHKHHHHHHHLVAELRLT